VIATDGSVRDVTLVSGDPKLANAATDAVRRWQYLPGIQNGEPIEVPRTIKLKYDLSKGESRPEEPMSNAPTSPSENLAQELASGEVFRVGPGIKAPKALYQPDPDYTEVARREKFQGALVLGLVVGANGNARSVWVVRSLGKGLDENAVQTVSSWRFAPATKDGEPVAVLLNVEVSFRLY